VRERRLHICLVLTVRTDWTEHPIISHVELYARYTSVVWSSLIDVKAPLPGARPPGVQLPFYPRKSSVPDKKGPDGKECSEVRKYALLRVVILTKSPGYASI
jgi:hypothetical protein